MGLVLFPIKTKIQAETSTLALRQYNEGLLQARSNILTFVYNHVLIGEGWQALKEHLLCHVSVIEGLIMVNEELICANSQLSDMVGWEILVEDDLQAIVNGLYEVYSALQNTLATLETMALLILDPAGRGAIEAAIISTQGSILICEQSIEYTNSKIQKIYDINAATAKIYIGFQTKYEDVNAGIAAIRNAWDGTSYNYSEMNMEWQTRLLDKWQSHESAIITEYYDVSTRPVLLDSNSVTDFFNLVSPIYNGLGNDVHEGVSSVGRIIGSVLTQRYGGIISVAVENNEVERRLWDFLDWPIGNLLAFTYNPYEDYYRTNESYGVQGIAGFTNMFDDLSALLGMDLDTDYIEFKYGNHVYRFQLWKGNYGLAYGSEIGFYQNSINTGWFASARNIISQEGASGWIGEIESEQYLLDRNGNVLIHNNTDAYAMGGDHYWNLMIRTSSGFSRGDLIQVCYVDFGDSSAVTSFIDQYAVDQDGDNPHDFVYEQVEDNPTVLRIEYAI